jgi:NAD(P)-dependent dehydrogenase (short-subunit alcohol dehydrogenase family)
MKIEGQVALVTGGASGLGAETARELARRGAKVTVLDRNGDGAKAVAAEFGGLGIACDITSTESIVAALDASRAAHGPARW